MAGRVHIDSNPHDRVTPPTARTYYFRPSPLPKSFNWRRGVRSIMPARHFPGDGIAPMDPTLPYKFIDEFILYCQNDGGKRFGDCTG